MISRSPLERLRLQYIDLSLVLIQLSKPLVRIYRLVEVASLPIGITGALCAERASLKIGVMSMGSPAASYPIPKGFRIVLVIYRICLQHEFTLPT